MIHDTRGRRKNNVAKLTGWQELDDPLLEIRYADIVTGRDDTGFVDSISFQYCVVKGGVLRRNKSSKDLPAIQLDDDLPGTVVVNFFELANVTYVAFVSLLRSIKRCTSEEIRRTCKIVA